MRWLDGIMVGWHHRLNGHEFEQTPGDGEGQGSLACCSPWGRRELDMRLSNWTMHKQDPMKMASEEGLGWKF